MASLASQFVDHGVRLAQAADGVNQDAHDRLKKLAAAIAALLLAVDFSRPAEVRVLIAHVKTLISAAYAAISATSAASIKELAAIEAQFVVSTVNATTKAALLTPTLTVTPAVAGRPLERWWDAQAKDTAFKVSNTIRESAHKKLDVEAIAQAIAVPLAAAQRNAQNLTHTAVQRVAMDARNAVLSLNNTAGVEIVATLDSRTCAQCLAYDGSTYDGDGNPTGDTTLPFNGGPPFHFSCRCITSPLIDGQKPSGGLSAEKWLDSKSADQQDELLGKGRAALYRRGSITLRDLVGKTGKQLSLADLRERYN